MSTLFFYLPFLLLFTLLAVYIERKLAAWIQQRLGPTETGYKGFQQSLADLLKLLQKEVVIPYQSDKILFYVIPICMFGAIFTGFAVLPVHSAWSGIQTTVGILYILAIVALEILLIILLAWSSNNKYAMLGAMRAIAQMLAYEIPLSLSILSVVIITQSLNLQKISFHQGIWAYKIYPIKRFMLFGINYFNLDITNVGGIFTWHIMQNPIFIIIYIIFFISSLAVSKRAPFDLPESESELIGGYHTEYSGLQFAFIMFVEYSLLLLMSMLGVILFLGSWNTPFPNIGSCMLAKWTSGTPETFWGSICAMWWLFSKTFFVIIVTIWIRWSFPRLRIDQLMEIAWKYLIPLSLILLLIVIFFCTTISYI